MSSRRNFLKIAGAGLTGSLLKPVSSSAAKLSVGKNPVKIGVLLPQSNEHPLYPGSFLSGLRLGLNQRQSLKRNKIELITESVNFGTPLITKAKVQQLITENNVNMVVGLINSEVAVDIEEMVKNAKLPTVIANAGENYLVQRVKENPYLFFNSLNLFQNSYLAGKHAVETYGKNIAVVTAFYDSGYDALFAFYKGVESAGGIITETYLKKQNDNDFIQNTLDKIKQEKPDGMFVFLNGNLADDFFRSAYHRELNTPIITSSFVVENNRLLDLGEAGQNIESFSTWTKNIENKENEVFVSAYQKQYSKDPDQFSFLGYETGLHAYTALAGSKGDFSGETISESIRKTSLKSPGGIIAVNHKSGLISNPVYLCKTQKSSFGLPENCAKNKYIPVSEFAEDFKVLETDLRSGWLNPYLFV